MVAMAIVLRPRDTGILRNSRLMGIPEFRSMANDLEIYRRSKVSEFGGPPKVEEGTHAYQQRFYHLLLSLLWRVCENYDDVSQTDFYKLYKWFHVTRELVKPPTNEIPLPPLPHGLPAPAPDYVSPFAKKKMKNEPVATIRMTTKTGVLKPELNLSYAETGYDGMRSRVDPAKYLSQGSTVSLAESMNSAMRHHSLNLRTNSARLKQVPSDVLLQALSEPEEMTKPPTPSTTSARVLGVLRQSPAVGERSSTAPAGITRQRRSNKTPRPNSVQNNISNMPHFPITTRSLSSIKGRYGYEINGEIDADATFVDIDGILDAGSDIIREIVSSPTPPPPRHTPPLPSVDVLTKRQLKLIGTTPSIEEGEGVTTPHIINAVNDLLQDTVKKSITAAERAKTTTLTAGILAELAEPIGEKMMINRARLLLLQHSPGHLLEKNPPKPPTAPPCFRRPCPSPLLESGAFSQVGLNESRSTYVNYERATTAPSFRNPPNTPKPVQPAIRIRRGSKNYKNVIPCKGEREDAVMGTFTVQPVYPSSRSETRSPYIHPVPPPSTSSMSSFHQVHEHVWVPGARTPHSERCSIYKDPVQEDHGYTPLLDEDCTLSETPLIADRDDPFSSLSSFLPSTHSLVNAM